MKCSVCHHVYPDTLSKCSRCGRVAPQRAAGESQSTLIEFPVNRATDAGARTDKASLPDWRIELNEKVRQVKARRSLEARFDGAAAARQKVPAPGAAHTSGAGARREDEALPPSEPANPIVAAALDRVRRASEHAARASRSSAAPALRSTPLPRTSPTAPPSRVLTLPAVTSVTAPLERPSLEDFAPSPAPVEETTLELAKPAGMTPVPFDPSELLEGLDEGFDFVERGRAMPGTELLPRPTVPAGLLARSFGGLIDAAVITVAIVPFVAIVEIVDGDFTRMSVQALLGATALLVASFYLFVMQALGGRTVGMIWSKTRVVGENGAAPPRPAAVALRVLAFFGAVLPAGLGLAWALLDRDRRALHDILSRTRVVEDAAEL